MSIFPNVPIMPILQAQYIKHIAVTAGSACEVVLKGVGSGHLDASGGQGIDIACRLFLHVGVPSRQYKCTWVSRHSVTIEHSK